MRTMGQHESHFAQHRGTFFLSSFRRHAFSAKPACEHAQSFELGEFLLHTDRALSKSNEYARENVCVCARSMMKIALEHW